MRYSWETLKVLHCFFLSRASWIQWRSPSLGVSGREASWDQVWVACCVFRSFVHPSLLPGRLSSALPLSFCPCLYPSLPILSPFSLPFQLLFPFLPPCLPPLFVPQSLPHYRRLFLCPCHFPISACLLPSVSQPFFSLSLSLSVLLRSFPPFLSPYPTRCSLISLDKLTNDISLAHSISLWFVFGFSFAWTTVLISIPFSETWCGKW